MKYRKILYLVIALCILVNNVAIAPYSNTELKYYLGLKVNYVWEANSSIRAQIFVGNMSSINKIRCMVLRRRTILNGKGIEFTVKDCNVINTNVYINFTHIYLIGPEMFHRFSSAKIGKSIFIPRGAYFKNRPKDLFIY